MFDRNIKEIGATLCVYPIVHRSVYKTKLNRKIGKANAQMAHLQAPTLKSKLRLAKELFSCQRSDCSTDRIIV